MTAAVLLHASASSSAQWRSLAGALAGSREVAAPDLRGYGNTPRWAGVGPFRLADEAAPLLALLDRLDAPVDLIGHSYGGAVALHLARTRPQAVRKLVLIEPVAFHLLRDGDEADAAGLKEFAGTAAAVRKAFAIGQQDEAGRIFIDYWNGEGAWSRLAPEKRAPVVAALPKLAQEIEAVLGDPAGARDMRRIHAPVLLLQGAETRLSARRVAQRLVRALPCVSHRVVPGAGHMLPLTHRDEVNRRVLEHLASPYEGGHWYGYGPTPAAANT
ncbi:MAG TPA: alpha/beta fold hydrolase [Burkholderiales bacterium]|nr:alpha/beta fold hydrolase [Burkholderiales bacterium]